MEYDDDRLQLHCALSCFLRVVALDSLSKSISQTRILPMSAQVGNGLAGVAHCRGPHKLARRHPQKQRGRTARIAEDWLIRSACRTTMIVRRGDWIDQVALACCFCIQRKKKEAGCDKQGTVESGRIMIFD